MYRVDPPRTAIGGGAYCLAAAGAIPCFWRYPNLLSTQCRISREEPVCKNEIVPFIRFAKIPVCYGQRILADSRATEDTGLPTDDHGPLWPTVAQVAALPTGCKTELCHYRQRYRPPSLLLLLYLWLTDADICRLSHPLLPKNNCCVRLSWRGLVTEACIREGGKCRVPAPMKVGPIATPAT